MPDPDRYSYLRINFYTPGAGLGKDVNPNTALLIKKYEHIYTYIKDMQLRSLDSRSLAQAFRHYQELKKRIRLREQKVEQEKDLVVQAKLKRIKDQRVPRLQDLTMRPSMSGGRKCIGTLESHENGLRFTSTKGEVLDVLYTNIQNAIYQPCQKSLMVLVHFHLKDAIIIGKKKLSDVQFYTEVVEASLNLDGGRRSSFDPDEMEEEQREREMKKRLNGAFKEFCKKVERVADHYGFKLEFEIPYIDLAFYGTCNKEMVMIQPTSNCLVNLTETPPFLVQLKDIDHIHFERVTYQATKSFDMTILIKGYDYVLPKSITLIDMKSLDLIQDWLNEMEITYSVGAQPINWKEAFEFFPPTDPYFWSETDEDGVPKAAGWYVLDASGMIEDDEEGGAEKEEDDSEFSSAASESSEDEGSSSDDESFESESSSDGDANSDDSEDEAGMDWDEMERQAVESDRQKRRTEEANDSPAPKSKKSRR